MVPQKGGAQKNPQGTFKSKNTAASRGGPNSLHHTAKPVHFVRLTVAVKGIFQRVKGVYFLSSWPQGHSLQLKELRFESQHGTTLFSGHLLMSGSLPAEGGTTHQKCYL